MPRWLKCLVATLVLAAITGALGYYGISGWDGQFGGHWYFIFGVTLVMPAIASGSWVVGGVIHVAFWAGIVWLLVATYPKKSR